MHQTKRLKTKIRRNALQYLKCGAKTVTFIFWISLYMLVMRMTIFKGGTVNERAQEMPNVPDNYTKWRMQGPVVGDDKETSNEWPEPDNNTVEELDSRVSRVLKVCRSRGISSQQLNSKEFFVDYAHNLVWCNIFKAASSSWLYKFNVLGGYSQMYLGRSRHTPLTLARMKFPRPSEEEVIDAVNTPGVISLLVVREPFERLLSAFRDKLENVAPPFYRNLARHIVGKYREEAKEKFGDIKTIGPTFYEFVAYIIDQHKSNETGFDEHWAPYYQFCSPCAVNFSVIAKVETLARDTGYVVNQLGLAHLLRRQIKDRRTRIRTVMNKSKDGKNTSALLKSYFSQIDRKMLSDLLVIYGLDFELFGYDSKIYGQYVSSQ